jgi:crossover junction endodeoxyribonuclease RusA
MKIILKGNPASNQTIYGMNCRGSFPTRYMTARGKSIKEQYQWEAKSQHKGRPLEREIEIDIELYFKDKRKKDIDNFGKILLDALTGIVWKDDSQIYRMTVEKFIDKDNPRIILEVYET